MLNFVIGVVALGALVVWLRRPGGRPPTSPWDEPEAPIDRPRLEEAERELSAAADPRPLTNPGEDDDDDWGPGAPRP